MRTLECFICKNVLPEERFSLARTTARGRQLYCKSCRIEKGFEYRQAQGPEYKRKMKHNHLMLNFNLTIDQYEQMCKERDGKCDICGQAPRAHPVSLCVDHCHTTGKIRGLLCSPCNRSIGFLGDTATGVERALNYLKKAE